MAKEIVLLKQVWLKVPLPMLVPSHGSTLIGAGPAWRGWKIELCRVTNELLISPPRDAAVGRLRVPMANVLAFQLSSATKTEP